MRFAVSMVPACDAEGAAVYPGQRGADGMLGDHALVTPPLVITSEQVAELVGCIDRALTRDGPRSQPCVTISLSTRSAS
jgi:adenosylmethionine-8-amino-7-oxononanoate aminotransferase